VPGRQRDDQITMKRRQRAPCNDQAAVRGSCECRDGSLDLGRVAHVDWAQFYPERGRHGLHGAELADALGYSRIPKHCRSRDARCDLFEQL
jgi:hypothetical protein